MALTSRLRSGAGVMSNGLIITPNLLGAQVSSLDLRFEPSVGIITKRLDALAMGLKDFRTPLKRAIQQVVIPSIQMNFHKHGRPRWAPLAESTVKRKAGNMVPLDRTGALREGMKDISIWTIGRQSAMLADLPQSIWYGKVHQAGMDFEIEQVAVRNVLTGQLTTGTFDEGEIGSIPPRPFVMIQESDEILIEKVFDIWLGERIAKAGLA